MSEWPDWESAWRTALYGPDGFFRRHAPGAHFRTAGHADAAGLAAALTTLGARHGCPAMLDIGCGRGELLTASAAHERWLQLAGVDVVARPVGLPERVAWYATGPEEPDRQGWSTALDHALADTPAGTLVICWELLDALPCPVLEVDEEGCARTVLVEATSGREGLGEPAGAPEQEWVRQWWPGAEPGTRIEVGLPRDRWWARLVAQAPPGTLLLAVDYEHRREERPPAGSLTGFRAGRAVPPRPDGTGDVTAHVALDAVAAAGVAAGARTLSHTDQASALEALGVRGGTGVELLDRGGLGGFGWLLQRT